MLAIMRVRVLGEAFLSSVHNEGMPGEVRNQDVQVIEIEEWESKGEKFITETGKPFMLRRQWFPNLGELTNRGVEDFDGLYRGMEMYVQVNMNLGHDAAYCWGMYEDGVDYEKAKTNLYASAMRD